MKGLIGLSAALFFGAAGMAGAQGGERCLNPAQVRDADVQRNAAVLGAGICISQIAIEEDGLSWRFTVIENTRHRRGPTIFLLHDNEQSAFDTAVYGIRRYGGKIVAVEAGDGREFRGQDPNRNFGTSKAGTVTCREMRRKPAPIFTRVLMDLRNTRPGFVLTLHNNANGHSGNGGSGGISAARQSAAMTGRMAPGDGDEDDAILLAGTRPLDRNAGAQDVIARLHRAKVNAIYEHVRPDRNDCSLSNYVVLNNLGTYYNIEAQHGHTAQQKRMLDILMQMERVKVRDKAVR
ncbi:hypothetical protein K1T73_15770 [Roseovarius sp. SCSIO 43702]|uniref:hypothetical protein n=1 Tax=Roseovarius sp. SCSIO 43702 TaxID=2823043 RepID=UPI001C72E22F|nr:hypothetical protein [Roseovarius sp. SCSIO 43702]QYX56486.1 hypothetical protein K1T73_15770 [Roseovarius sp. SCSIO 43702]